MGERLQELLLGRLVLLALVAGQDDDLIKAFILPIWEAVELDALIPAEEVSRQAHEILIRGSTLVQAQSRFSARETTITIESEE